MRTMRVIAGCLQISCCLVVILTFVSCGIIHDRVAHCYIFQPGFRGWVSVSYGVDSGENPKSNQECIVFDFNGRVHIDTKLAAPVGWANDRYLESGLDITDLGLESDPEAKENVRGVRDNYFEFTGDTAREWIFIGTKQDYASTPRPKS